MIDQQPGEALVAYRKALELYPEYLEERYFTFGSNVEKGIHDILGGCMDAMQLQRDYAKVYYNLGKAYLELNQVEDAIESFKRCSDLVPYLIEPLESLAAIYESQGMRSLATEALAHVRFNQALAYLKVDSLEAARVRLMEAIGLKPDYAPAFAQLGALYDKTNDTKAADKAFKKALELDPHDPQVHLAYGEYLSGKQEWEKAKGSFEKAIELDPQSLVARQRLIDALKALNLENEAIKQLAEIYHLSGQTFEYAGSWDRALEEYAKAGKLDTSNAEYPASQGLIYAKKQLYGVAESFFQRALELDPQNVRSLYGMGLIFGDQEQYEKAIYYLNQAVSFDPSFALAHHLLAKNSYFVGDLQGAQEHLEIAEKLGMPVKEEFLQELDQ